MAISTQELMKLSAGAFQKYTREDTEICLENVVYTQGIYVEIMGIYVLESNKPILIGQEMATVQSSNRLFVSGIMVQPTLVRVDVIIDPSSALEVFKKYHACDNLCTPYEHNGISIYSLINKKFIT